ncbi:MAG: hypothetical protein LBU92_06825 [Prevotellaceae bacterium]|nr:hypothetical protein [Prevotellaceae bacterium]
MKKVWCMAVAAVVAFSGSSFAQQAAAFGEELTVREVRSEFSVWGLGGISSFMYSPAVGSTIPGFGGGGGLGLTRFFTPNVGLRIGAEVMTFSTVFKGQNFVTNYATPLGEPYDFRFKSYEETQTATVLNIPVMGAYEQDWFYASLGMKVGVMLNSKYTATIDSLFKVENSNEAYYSANIKNSDKLKLGLNLALSAEVGARWKLGDRTSLYAGIFADYGLLNVSGKNNEHLIDYIEGGAPAEDHKFHSILNAAQADDFPYKRDFVHQASLLSVGLKVALSVSSSTLFTSTKKPADYEMLQAQADEAAYYDAPMTREEYQPQQSADEKSEQKVTAKERAKADKEQKKAEKQAAKERAKLTPIQQQMEYDIAELKRTQEMLMQQAEATNKNQEAILGAVKAAQDAATAAAEAARAAQTAVVSMQENTEKKTERKAPARAREGARQLSFKIQISARGTHLEDIDEPFAKYGLGMKITEELHSDDANNFSYKYVVGSYKQLDVAVEACNEVRSKGIADAFVVAYYKGNRITMTEAYELLNRN